MPPAARDQQLHADPAADRRRGGHHGQQPALGIDGDVPALPLIFFPPWKPRLPFPTVSAALTICESTITAVGSGPRR
jgi:hypothetical protein